MADAASSRFPETDRITEIHPAWLTHQDKRWMRDNAHRFLRPDAERWRQHNRNRYGGWQPDARKSRLDPVPLPASDTDAAASESELASLRVDIAALRFQLALIKFEYVQRKYRPDQPRVPAGNSDGGQWTSEGGGGNDPRVVSDATSDNEWIPGAQYAQNWPAGIGHNQGPPLEDPPAVPQDQPATAQARNALIKSAAQWLARAARIGAPIGGLLTALDAASWLDTDRPYIDAYQDPPKTLEELQQAVSRPERGYNIHHIVEQTSAEQDGFSRDMIDASDNLVRIPTLKHWEITGWYARPNRTYGMEPPRAYLRRKDWDERVRVGHEALVIHGVLKR